MAKQVIKRDGTKEVFDENKIRKAIEEAGKDAGLAEDQIKPVVEQVAGTAIKAAAAKEEIATSELATVILSQLDQVNPVMAEAWRKHNQAKGRV